MKSALLGGRRVLEVRLTDKARTDAKVALPAALPPRSFCVVLLSASSAD